MSILRRAGTSAGRTRSLSRAPRNGATTRARSGIEADRFAEMADAEQFILTITENGYGKRTSAYEYRRTGRGGQGITNIDTGRAQWRRGGELPGQAGRADHAGDRPGQDDPHHRRLDPHRRPQHAGRDDLPRRQVRACRLGRAHRRGGRGRGRGAERRRGRASTTAPTPASRNSTSRWIRASARSDQWRLGAGRGATLARGPSVLFPVGKEEILNAHSQSCAGPGGRRPQDAVLPQRRRREPDRPAHRSA